MTPRRLQLLTIIIIITYKNKFVLICIVKEPEIGFSYSNTFPIPSFCKDPNMLILLHHLF